MNSKPITTALLMLTAQLGLAQITIKRTDMPKAQDTVYMGITTNLNGVDATLTGADFMWDFSQLNSTTTRLDTFVSVTSAPIAYQLYFNNQITKNSSDVAIKIDDIPLPALSPIQITKVYGFYKNPNKPVIPIINPNPERLYAQTGFGAMVNGLPLSVALDPQYDMDVWFKFPLNYGNVDSCYSTWKIDVPNVAFVEEKRHRYNQVDGWGMVTTPLGTFNCLRVKSYSVLNDSLKLKSGIAGALPGIIFTQYITEYKWIVAGKKEPVLKVTYNSTNPTTLGLLTTVEYQTLNPTNALPSLTKIDGVTMYYSNTSHQLIINKTTTVATTLVVIDGAGKTVINELINNTNQTINLSHLPKGLYIAQLQQGLATQVLKCVTE